MQVSPSNFLIIGRLADIKDAHTGMHGNEHPYINVTPNSYKFLEPKNAYNSVLANGHHKIRVYIGSITNDTPFKYSRDDESASEKAHEIYWHYQHDIFIIRPSYNIHGDNVTVTGKSKCVFVMDGQKKYHNIDLGSQTLTPVPIFNKDNTVKGINTQQDFEDALDNRQIIGDIDKYPWPTNKKAVPDGIIWQVGDSYYLYINLTLQNVMIKNPKTTDCYEQVGYGFFDTARSAYVFDKHELYHDNYVYQDSLAFIDYDKYIVDNGLMVDPYDSINDVTQNGDPYEREGTSLFSFAGIRSLTHPDHTYTGNQFGRVSASSVSDTDSGQDAGHISPSSESLANPDYLQKTEAENLSTPVSQDVKNQANVDFIHKLEHLAYIHKPRLYYRREDLINFHTAMKCDGLVVLAGLSGTGKSALINLYAQALGLKPDQYKFISVRPFWNDDSDLLGYVDTIHSRYQPASSGLVNTLIDASHHPNHLYLITFDEMNLARVEYYFSQFLSILEKDSDDRYIQLYNPHLSQRLLYNSNEYPSRVKIGRNVLFTGTINLDESTHKFSDKVLDRSNIINLKLVPYFEDSEYHDPDVSASTMSQSVSTQDFEDMKDCSKSNGLTLNELKMLWRIHKALNHANRNLGIGRRIVNQIDQYLRNLPQLKENTITQGEALDWQLVQRVFTKVRGSKEDIGNILNPDNDEPDNLIHILKAHSDISDFKSSIDVLKHKYQEVKEYGFTV